MAANDAIPPVIKQRTIANSEDGGERPTADVDATAAALELRATNSSTNTKSRDGTAFSGGGMAGQTVAPATSAQRLVDPVSLEGDGYADGRPREFKVYRRRWFALVQLSLLNIIVSWDVCGHAVLTLALAAF